MNDQHDEPVAIRNDRAIRLLVRHQDELRAYITALRPLGTVCEDIHQTVCAEVLKSRLPENDDECLRWMLAVARHCIFRERRKNRRMDVNHALAEDAMAETIAEGFVRVAERRAVDLQTEAFESGLGTLSPPDRALLLAYYATKNGAKNTLAEELGITLDHLRHQIRRVRDELKNHIQRRLAQENFR